MVSEKLASRLEKYGARMDHIGVLSLNRERSIEFLSLLPDVPEADKWKYFDRVYKKEHLLVGTGYTLRVATAPIEKQSYYLEVVQPVLEQCDKESYYYKHMTKHREGFHHVAYEVVKEEQLHELIDVFKKNGDIILFHGRLAFRDDSPTGKGVEFVYIEPGNGCHCVLELVCRDI